MRRNTRALFEELWSNDRHVCLDLDPDLQPTQPPTSKLGKAELIATTNCDIVQATKDLVAAYRLNLHRYLMHGTPGLHALCDSFGWIREIAPDIPLILDIEQEIGDTDQCVDQMITLAFGLCEADVVTLRPLERRLLAPFLNDADKFAFIPCPRNEAAALPAEDGDQKFIRLVNNWNIFNNVGLSFDTADHQEIRQARQTLSVPLLIQVSDTRGDVFRETVRASRRSDRLGEVLFSPASKHVYAPNSPNFADTARESVISLQAQIDLGRKVV